MRPEAENTSDSDQTQIIHRSRRTAEKAASAAESVPAAERLRRAAVERTVRVRRATGAGADPAVEAGLRHDPVPAVASNTPPASAPTTATTATTADAAEEPRTPRWFSVLRWLPLVAGFGLWAVSLPSIDIAAVDSYGLLPALPREWLLGLGFLIVGAVSALGARTPPRALLACYGLGMVLVLYGTIPAVSEVPQYAYVYKHIGVTRFVDLNGTVDPSVDIYHRWPGFFTLTALFGAIAGEPNPVEYAAWAEPFFAAVLLLLVYALGRALLGGTRVPWLAAYLFTVTNWIGQTYFAPQALGVTLGVAVYVVVVGQLTSLRPSKLASFALRISSRLRPSSPASLDLRNAVPSWPTWAAVGVCVLLYAAVAGSHQLSPYLILLAVGVLTLLGMLRPRWLPVLLAAVAIGYLIPNFEFINERFGLFSDLDPISNATNDGATVTALSKSAGKILYARAGLLLVFGTWLCAFVAALINLRRGRVRPGVVPVAVLFASWAIFFAQTYGGEGRLRVFLFTLPWCTLAIASMLLPESRPRMVQLARAGVALTVATALWMCAFLIPYDANRLTRQEVEAAEWLYRNGDPQMQIVLADPDFPSNVHPDYPPFTRWFSVPYSLLEDPEFRENSLGRGERAELAGTVRALRFFGPSAYLVFSRSMRVYADTFGLAEPGTLDRLQDAVAADPRFTLIYSNDDVAIFELLPPAQPSTDDPGDS